MGKLGIFFDVSNLYHCLKHKFGKRKLDYGKYLAFVDDFGQREIAIAYGSQVDCEADAFLARLVSLGITPRFKKTKEFYNGTHKADWDVGLTVDILDHCDNLDTIVIGSADGDLSPLVDKLLAKGKKVIIVASGISHELKNVSCIEIPESLLES